MLNCKQATILISQSMDGKLGSKQKIGLALHLLRCSGCRTYRKQLMVLRKGAQKYSQHSNDIDS